MNLRDIAVSHKRSTERQARVKRTVRRSRFGTLCLAGPGNRQSMARLSVVIPTWNAVDLVSKALEHLTGNGCPSWADVIVVDDGSQDDTARRIQARFEAVQVIRHDVNRGFGGAVNTGFKAARGDFLAAVNNPPLVFGSSCPS